MPDASPVPIDAPEIVVNRAFLWRISIIGGLAGILYGYDIGIIDAALVFVNKSFALDNFVFHGHNISDLIQEIVVSAVLVGAMIGTFWGGMIADRIGRRGTLIWGAAIFIVGSLLAQFSPDVWTFIVARGVLGISIGFTSVTAPVFLSELSPPRSRGTLIGLYQLNLTLGIALSNVVGYLLADAHDWRHMLGIGAVPATVLLLLVFTLPESPRWLCARGLFDKARAVLDTYTNPAGATLLLDEIRAALKDRVETRWSALFTRAVRPYFFIASGFLILLAVTGINAVIYYGTTIFTFAGINEEKGAILANLVITTVNVLATIVGLLFVDRIGRKPLLYLGLAGMFVSLVLLAAAFYNKAVFGSALGVIAISCLTLYIACFGFSLGVIGWILAAELFPLPVRGRGIAAASLAYAVANLVVSVTFLSLVSSVGAPGTFAIYAFFCIVSLIFVLLFVPETKGVELESISHRAAVSEG